MKQDYRNTPHNTPSETLKDFLESLFQSSPHLREIDRRLVAAMTDAFRCQRPPSPAPESSPRTLSPAISQNSPYALTLSPDVLATTTGGPWTLGTVCFTEGALQHAERTGGAGPSVDAMLTRHQSGDYGLISDCPEDLKRNSECRRESRRFTSFYPSGDQIIKVVTSPSEGRTYMCLLSED